MRRAPQRGRSGGMNRPRCYVAVPMTAFGTEHKVAALVGLADHQLRELISLDFPPLTLRTPDRTVWPVAAEPAILRDLLTIDQPAHKEKPA
jgi:hypothetical protein